MTDEQWQQLVSVIEGEIPESIPIGFIIDSPWLPNWFGISMLDYFSSEEQWLRANLAAIETFPDVIFLPGFWSEFGMCTEPSAFGAKSIYWKNEFPFAEKVIHDTSEIDALEVPNAETDGLLPFMLHRLTANQDAIEDAGHAIRFSVSRGPLNVASFLMGSTELMTAMMMEPDAVNTLMRKVTDFLKEWHRLQREAIPSIDGMLMLDDIVGFVGEDEFLEFGYPYFEELYDLPASIKFFHNDADCTVSVSHYPDLGINLFNPGTHMTLNEIKAVTDNRMAILGNIPPRDVLAAGSPDEVTQAVKSLLNETEDHSRLVLSSGGGMPPDVSSENIKAFIQAVKNFS
ncbi:MAG: uroporphyrinogen decarboxylase [Candidatus Marinimicrobia bacterium]|nr:uroporphyrinogen decarboxylase [Candidatus Neomarinimicrobiota bacterium]MCF7827638.1 uroporphyrinogen decarboxylase [Candidatus Neomarinimicrobiota bacterium]MCF7881307.1 uroporphyrinogen decarboxylase [Candidatus Neomarinimicrobiota bacterium]